MAKDLSIHFGTSGWRAVIGDEFTFANVRKVCRAISKYVKDQRLSSRGIVVGYDTRFLSQEFAQTCAQTLAENNIPAFLTNRDTPTPVISYQILKRKAAGGINITASHNPPKYNGIKFSPVYGGPAAPEVTRQIEKNIKLTSPFSSKRQSAVKIFDPRPAYLARIKQLVNFQAIRKARLRIAVDVLYGTGRGYLDELLRSAGASLTVLHKELNPSFGGFPPEPARAQLRELAGLVKKKHLHLGLAVDGDADRFGIVDRGGTYIGANEIISLLTYHLIATRPRQKSVARTLATTHMVDALAQKAGLELVETPVGFKYIGQQIAAGGCLIGSEESGGLSIVGHVPEKDGILACLLIAELVAARKKSLGEILKELYQEVGLFVNTRIDFHLKQKEKTNFMRNLKPFSRKPSLLGEQIIKFDGRDGYKFVFADASWMMFRASGTEAVVRCYCEAGTKTRLNTLRQLGERLVKKFVRN